MKNDILKQAIKNAGFTQERLGVKIGVTGQTINNAVNGKMPHENTRKAICKVLGISVEDIFGDYINKKGGE